MAIRVTEAKKGMVIRYEGELFQIMKYDHVTPGNWRAIHHLNLKNLKNGKQKSVRVPSDTYNVKVAADADNSVVVFDEDLTLNSGEVTIVYAVGSLAGESFTVLAQVKDAKYIWGGENVR